MWSGLWSEVKSESYSLNTAGAGGNLFVSLTVERIERMEVKTILILLVLNIGLPTLDTVTDINLVVKLYRGAQYCPGAGHHPLSVTRTQLATVQMKIIKMSVDIIFGGTACRISDYINLTLFSGRGEGMKDIKFAKDTPISPEYVLCQFWIYTVRGLS